MGDKQRVVLTGAQGFIGKALSRALSQAGFSVFGVDIAGGSDDRKTDLLDLQSTRETIKIASPFSILIHTAALAHGQKPPPNETCMSVNTKITENLMATVEDVAPRIVFFSSVAVYGEDDRMGPVDPADDVLPATEYGRSKLLCEKLILESNLKHCDILRMAPVWDDQHMKDVRKRVYLPGQTKIKMMMIPPPQYSLCHLDTVVRVVLDLVNSPASGRGIRNVCDPQPYGQREIASWFSGISVPIPVPLLEPLYWMTRLMPARAGYSARCLYWKLLRSNVYALSQTES